jgi:hypothetical protein
MMEQEEVMAFLEPWFERLSTPFHNAMKLYNEQYPEFGAEPRFAFLSVRRLQVLNMHDRLVARWKKVNEEGRHRNADTEQQRNFDRQRPLPNLPDEALRITLGYEPDPAFSACQRIMVARPQGDSIVWASQIVEDEGVYSWVDITPQRLPGTDPITSGIQFKKPK